MGRLNVSPISIFADDDVYTCDFCTDPQLEHSPIFVDPEDNYTIVAIKVPDRNGQAKRHFFLACDVCSERLMRLGYDKATGRLWADHTA